MLLVEVVQWMDIIVFLTSIQQPGYLGEGFQDWRLIFSRAALHTQSVETMTSVSDGHIILTPNDWTRGSNSRPLQDKSSALPTETTPSIPPPKERSIMELIRLSHELVFQSVWLLEPERVHQPWRCQKWSHRGGLVSWQTWFTREHCPSYCRRYFRKVSKREQWKINVLR